MVGAKGLNASITLAPAARVASFAFCSGSNVGQRPLPAVEQLPGLSAVPVLGRLGERLAPAVEARLPVGLELRPVLAPGHVLVHPVGDDEALVRVEAEHLLRRPDLVLAEGRAVGLGGVHGVRSGIGDVTAHGDERRARGVLPGRSDGGIEGLDVVHVLHPLHVPAVGRKTGAFVLGVERQRRCAVDCDAVVVVEDEQLAETERPGERSGFLADALHQIAVGGDDVDPMVDDLVSGPVVALSEKPLGRSQADRVGEALPERPGRRLHPCGEEVLGVAWRP